MKRKSPRCVIELMGAYSKVCQYTVCFVDMQTLEY